MNWKYFCKITWEKLIVFALLMMGLLNPTKNVGDGLIGVILFVYVFFVVYRVFLKNTKHKFIIILPILVAFLITSIINSSDLRDFLSVNPREHEYTYDMGLYLKTYYLMKDGAWNYYQAHANAFNDHAVFGLGNLPTDVWGWRLPTLFYLWSIIPISNGVVIWWMFIGFCLLTFLAVYEITRLTLSKEKSYLAILAPYLFFPYLHFAARDWTMLQVEWWAVMIMIWGIYFYLKKKKLWSIVFFSLAMITRELLLIPFLILVFLAWLFKKRELKYFLIPVIVFIIFLIGHTLFVSQQVILIKGLSKYHFRLHGDGKSLLLTTLAFGSWEYLFYNLRLFTLMLGLVVIGFLRQITWRKTVVTASLILPLSYLLIGTSQWNHVWGVLYVPFIFLGLPWLINNFKTNKQH